MTLEYLGLWEELYNPALTQRDRHPADANSGRCWGTAVAEIVPRVNTEMTYHGAGRGRKRRKRVFARLRVKSPLRSACGLEWFNRPAGLKTGAEAALAALAEFAEQGSPLGVARHPPHRGKKGVSADVAQSCDGSLQPRNSVQSLFPMIRSLGCRL